MANPIPANILQEQKTLKDSRELKAGQEDFYRIWQSYASPYSYKVMSFMNYKGIPYKRMEADLNANMSEIPRLVGQSIIPVILTPDEQVMQDSTPIFEHFEKQYPDKATIPDDKRLEFIMWILEEFSDEYMPRMHMHTRWGNEQNRHTISHRVAQAPKPVTWLNFYCHVNRVLINTWALAAMTFAPTWINRFWTFLKFWKNTLKNTSSCWASSHPWPTSHYLAR